MVLCLFSGGGGIRQRLLSGLKTESHYFKSYYNLNDERIDRHKTQNRCVEFRTKDTEDTAFTDMYKLYFICVCVVRAHKYVCILRNDYINVQRMN